MFEDIEEAIADLKQGKIVIVVDDEDPETKGLWPWLKNVRRKSSTLW